MYSAHADVDADMYGDGHGDMDGDADMYGDGHGDLVLLGRGSKNGFSHDITRWNTPSLAYSSDMFRAATAWLSAYTRSPSGTADGPPSAWNLTLNADLAAAVNACLAQDPTAGCACGGTSCSNNSRFSGTAL